MDRLNAIVRFVLSLGNMSNNTPIPLDGVSATI